MTANTPHPAATRLRSGQILPGADPLLSVERDPGVLPDATLPNPADATTADVHVSPQMQGNQAGASPAPNIDAEETSVTALDEALPPAPSSALADVAGNSLIALGAMQPPGTDDVAPVGTA